MSSKEFESTFEDHLVREIENEFIHKVSPTTLIPKFRVNVLSPADESKIAARHRYDGIHEAARLMLEVVQRKENWFDELLKALRACPTQRYLADNFAATKERLLMGWDKDGVSSESSDADPGESLPGSPKGESNKAVQTGSSLRGSTCTGRSPSTTRSTNTEETRLVFADQRKSTDLDEEQVCPSKHDEKTITYDRSNCSFDYTNVRRVVMFGDPGAGKTATCSTILRKKFENREIFRQPFCGETHKQLVQIEKLSAPSLSQWVSEMESCGHILAQGKHAFIMVTAFQNSEPGVMDCLKMAEMLAKVFGIRILDYMIVVFTHKDKIQNWSDSAEVCVNSLPQKMSSFLQRCGNRYLFLNNCSPPEEKMRFVKDMMNMINKVVNRNGGKSFSMK